MTTPHGADLVTPADARAVVAAFWPQHERVVVARDLRGISALSTGAARLYEVGGLACGCWEQLSERRLVAATYFVRHQTRYPVDFLVNTESAVVGRTLPSPWTDLFVFTKAAAGKPWLMTLHSGMAYTGATSPPMFEPYTDAQGYLREYRPSDAAALHARALLLAQETASLWQTSKDTGRIPDHPTLSVTGVNEQRLLDLAAHRQGQRQVNGALGTYRFWVAPPDPLFEYEGAGWEVACRAVRETVRFTPPTGLVLVQGTAYRPWGYPVPAGRYLSATTTGAWQTCWVSSVMPNTPASPLLNSSDMGGTTVATP